MTRTLNMYLPVGDRNLERYLKEIQKYEPLSPEEERELAARIEKGDKEARDKLVKANLRFVVSIAKKYQGQGMPMTDLINEGNIGLITAAEKFDGKRGYKFISYAVWWIRQAILAAMAEKSRVIRMPINRVALLSKISKTYGLLEQDMEGKRPDVEEIAEELGVSSEQVERALREARQPYSLDAPFGDEDERNLLGVLEDESQVSPEDQLLERTLSEDIESVLETLDEREAEIMRLYFGLGGEEPLTLDEIGYRYNLTRERIRQIKEKALSRLRHPKRRRRLGAYLE